MVKSYPLLLKKEQMDKLMDVIEKENEFDYLLFSILKTTGRRIGEIYGVQDVKELKPKFVGKKEVYIEGKKVLIDRVVPQYKKLNNWSYGVKRKDVDLEKMSMKVWILKRGQYIQDETILTPEITRLIKKHIIKHQLRNEDFIFRMEGRGIRQINNILKNYAEKCNIPKQYEENNIKYGLSVHSFRHYFITSFKRKGWSDDLIIKLTGHKSTNTLRHYDHIVADDIRDKAMEVLRDM